MSVNPQIRDLSVEDVQTVSGGFVNVILGFLAVKLADKAVSDIGEKGLSYGLADWANEAANRKNKK